MEDLGGLCRQKQKLRFEQMEDLEKLYQQKQKLRLVFVTEIKKNSKLIKIELNILKTIICQKKEMVRK